MKKYLSILFLFGLLLFSTSSCSFEPEDIVPQETTPERADNLEPADPPFEDLDPFIREELNYAIRNKDIKSKVSFTLDNGDGLEDGESPNVLHDYVIQSGRAKLEKTN